MFAIIIAYSRWASPGLVQGDGRYIKVFNLRIICSVDVPKRNTAIGFFSIYKFSPMHRA